jgi:hypothetical protein
LSPRSLIVLVAEGQAIELSVVGGNMRKAFVVLSLLVAVSGNGVSQVMSCETDYEGPGKRVSGTPAPIFELKKPFPHPVPLPNHVLALLRADEANVGKLEACSRGSLSQIPREWFTATELKIVDNGLPGLIVKTANSCLWNSDGASESGYFWVFRQAPTGYQLLLREQTQALQVLATRTAGYPDLCTIWEGIGRMEISQNVYTFRDGKYKETVSHFINVDYFPPSPGQTKITVKPSPKQH